MSRSNATELTHGLVIRTEPLRLILAGEKNWEVRGRSTRIRGPIALIEGGTGHIVGLAELVEVVGPLSAAGIADRAGKTGYVRLPVKYRQYYGWVLNGPVRLRKPVRYDHPRGAVTWVRLVRSVAEGVRAQAKTT